MPTTSENALTLAIKNNIYKSKNNHSNNFDPKPSFSSYKPPEKKINFKSFDPSSLKAHKKKCISIKENPKPAFKKASYKPTEENGINKTLYMKSSLYKQSSKSNEANGTHETLYPKSLVHTWRPDHRDKTGLRNLGNTCYLNATLQVCIQSIFFRFTIQNKKT